MLTRYVRALWIALKFSLRGETYIPPSPHPHLMAWVRDAEQLVDAVYQAAEGDSLDEGARRAIVVKVDGRGLSMELILASVKHNTAREYPQLLLSRVEHQLTVFYAGNLNDRYRIQRLCEADAIAQGSESLQENLTALKQHLEDIPQEEFSPKSNS